MSIVEVAHLAGVSKSTVSRVINQSPKVAPSVAQTVRDAMQRLGYEPALRRRGRKPASRRGIRTGNIALLVMGMRAGDLYRLPVFPSLLHGVERQLAEHKLNLILANLGVEEGLPAVLNGNQADGLLLFGRWDGMPASVRAKLRQLPAVWLVRGHSDAAGEFDHVFYNNASVGPLAARYLINRGHRRLALLNAVGRHPAFAQRHHDFAAVVEEAGFTPKLVVSMGEEGAVNSSVFESLVDQLLEGPESQRPTGLFVPTDVQVPEVYQALRARGIEPGRDIEIISCDAQQQFLSGLTPRGATIDINLELVGRRGVQQLLWRMRNPEVKNRITLLVEPTLVLPESPAAGDHADRVASKQQSEHIS